MLRRLLIALSLVAFLIPVSASAHFLKTDNNIGVVLHIDPDDDPAAGQTATIFMDTKDKQGKYQPSDCNCQINILQNGKTLDSLAVTQADATTSTASYVFPAIGVYQVEFQGAPYNAGDFQNFKVTWDVRVDHTGNGSSTMSAFWQQFFGHGLHFVLIGIATVFMLGYIALENKRERERKAKLPAKK